MSKNTGSVSNEALNVNTSAPNLPPEQLCEAFVASMRRRQIWEVEHRTDAITGFRINVPVFGDDSLLMHLGCHLEQLLGFSRNSLPPGVQSFGQLPFIEQVGLAFQAFCALEPHTQLVFAAADLDLCLGESLTAEEIERYRPLVRLLEEDSDA